MWYYIFKGKKPKKCKKLPKIPQMKMPFIIEKMGRAICLYRAKYVCIGQKRRIFISCVCNISCVVLEVYYRK